MAATSFRGLRSWEREPVGASQSGRIALLVALRRSGGKAGQGAGGVVFNINEVTGAAILPVPSLSAPIGRGDQRYGNERKSSNTVNDGSSPSRSRRERSLARRVRFPLTLGFAPDKSGSSIVRLVGGVICGPVRPTEPTLEILRCDYAN